MPYTLSDDEALVQKTVRELALRHGLEAASEADRYDRVPEAALTEAAGLGLLGLGASLEAGGAGGTAFALAVHEMAQVDASLAALLAVQAAAVRAAADKPELVAVLATEPCTLLVTEEAYGSDTSSVGTKATPDGAGGWLLTGQKVWGVGAAVAKHHLVLADAPGGAALFHVPASAAGVSLSQPEGLLGLRAAGIRTVYFSKVKLPASALVAAPGQGLPAVRRGRAALQLGAAAALAGCVAGAYTAARDFATNRVQFGSPIGTYQAVSDGVTQVDIQLEAARALVLAAAAQLDGPDAALWSARAKAFASEVAVAMTRQAIRIQGGTGFMREGGSERFARDARVLQFLGETVQMQRDTIKRAVLPDVAFPATP